MLQPVVLPSNTPDRIFTTSSSRRWVVYFEVPGLRRSRSPCRSASLSSSPGGQPSTMQPSARPWLSPKVVTVKSLPNELPDIGFLLDRSAGYGYQKRKTGRHYNRRRAPVRNALPAPIFNFISRD